MNVLSPRLKSEFDDKVIETIKLLKYKNNPIELKGSSGLRSQQYFSDYDLFTVITKTPTAKDIYQFFDELIATLSTSYGLYFIELKIQTKDGKKIRWFPNNPLTYKEFRQYYADVDFIKIDIIARIQYKFIEISCIYKFSNVPLTEKEYKSQLVRDIIDLKKDNEYYKALKRIFNLYKVEKNNEKLLFLNKVFNSKLGSIYQFISNLKAIKSVLADYGENPIAKKEVMANLADLRVDIDDIDDTIDKYSSALNKEGKKIYEGFVGGVVRT
jgi:hypothetical protein